MKPDQSVKRLLCLIAVLLGLIALRPFLAPEVTQASSAEESYPVYVEPGVTLLTAPDGRTQQTGKVVIDLRNGNIWGFPTLGQRPYPVDPGSSKPPVSNPIYLGEFEFAAMRER